MSAALLEVIELCKYFYPQHGHKNRKQPVLRAVDGVSFTVGKGETVGLVGESGCGKSTLGRVILRLLEPTAGQILFNGNNIERLSAKELLPYRKQMQVVFQDPAGALNPRYCIGTALQETVRVHRLTTNSKDAEEKSVKLLKAVGLDRHYLSRYPHQLSGGQLQRIVLARALAVEPQLIVCDEPVSALDVSIQAQILNLLQELQATLGLSYLFIAHNLAVVRHISDRIAVMYLGKIVEFATTNELYNNPQHPYTQALLSAIPVADPHSKRDRIILQGEVPSPLEPPQGCSFHTRCPHTFDRCKKETPALNRIGPQHQAACHLL